MTSFSNDEKEKRDDLAKAINRIALGVLILFHTRAVLLGEQAIRDTLMAWGLPIELAYTAIFFEGLAPIMVILGVFARIGAGVMTFWMVLAFLMAHVHTGHLWQLTENGVSWRIEVPLFFLVGSVVVLLQGAGRYSLNIGGKWN